MGLLDAHDYGGDDLKESLQRADRIAQNPKDVTCSGIKNLQPPRIYADMVMHHQMPFPLRHIPPFILLHVFIDRGGATAADPLYPPSNSKGTFRFLSAIYSPYINYWCTSHHS